MNAFDQSITVLEELFSRNREFVLATVRGGVPAQRVVDAFYDDGAFWFLTHAQSNKVEEIRCNSHVSLCREFHNFNGVARFVGEQPSVKRRLDKPHEPWYFIPSDHRARSMCYIRVELSHAFFHKDGVGYKVDFAAKTAETVPFAPKK